MLNKTNMKHFVLFIIVTGIYSNIIAQQSNTDCKSDENYVSFLRKGLMGLEYKDALKGFTGNRYFGPWSTGEVILQNGDIITHIPLLRYEQYSHELLWLRKRDMKTGIFNKDQVKAFNLFDESNNFEASFVKIRTKLKFDSDSTDRYMQVLESGKFTLYVYRSVIKAVSEFVLVDNTKYLIFNNGQYTLVSLNRRSLMQIPTIDKYRMKLVIKSNNLKVKRNEPDFVRAVKLYNQTLS
jgi:hypothetical protein